jgi:hypothetical protein
MAADGEAGVVSKQNGGENSYETSARGREVGESKALREGGTPFSVSPIPVRSNAADRSPNSTFSLVFLFSAILTNSATAFIRRLLLRALADSAAGSRDGFSRSILLASLSFTSYHNSALSVGG